MISKFGASAYAQIGLETGVAAANPHRMILMLYDGAVRYITDAESHLAAKRIPEKGQAVSRAISVIEEGLKASLDLERGGDIAVQLDRLYDYMCQKLLLSSLRNEPVGFREIAGLLVDLRSAWQSIANESAVIPAAIVAKPINASTFINRFATA